MQVGQVEIFGRGSVHAVLTLMDPVVYVAVARCACGSDCEGCQAVDRAGGVCLK